MEEYGKLWEVMRRYEKVWEGMEKYGMVLEMIVKVCEDMARYGKI